MKEGKILTLQALKDMPENHVFAKGEAVNAPGGIFMCNSDVGRTLRWVAQRGGMWDWAIYIHWAEYDYEWVERYGDKVFMELNIRKLVPCDDEAFAMYRY